MLARVLPGNCRLCDGGSGGRFLCVRCAAELPVWLPAEACPVCAQRSPAGLDCGRCLQSRPAFDATRAIWRYEFPVDRLVQDLKYGLNLSGVRFFSDAVARQVPARPFDLIVPVPLAPSRLRTRGYNQSVEIARQLARKSKTMLAITSVRRSGDERPQASLPWKERVSNVRGAFECSIDLSGQSVLVVDDVMTTGATLDELARELKGHGAIWVENLVLARVLKD